MKKTSGQNNGRDDEEFPFINVKSDYGFKWYFGQLKHKHLLIRLLNAVFRRAGRDIVVADIAYHDKEILPAYEDGKKIIYDIYCSTPENHHLIVEMQNVYEPFFEDRVVFYTIRMTSDQGQTGWNYNLEPVFSIVVANFNLRNLPKQLFHDIVLYDKETQTIYSDKLNIFFICLPQLPATWGECRTDFEKQVYLVDNLGILNKNSEAYKDMEYRDFFKAAEKKNMSNEEYILYSQSELKEAEYKRAIEFAAQEAAQEAAQKAAQEALVKGRAEGRAEGRLSSAIEIARNLLKSKLDINAISTACGLDINQVKELAAQM